MPRTPFGKTRDVEKPYAIYTNPQGWEWRILKTYQHPDKEKTNQYARWYVAARSPMTHGSWEYGQRIMIEYIGIVLTGSAMIIIIAYLALDQLISMVWNHLDKAERKDHEETYKESDKTTTSLQKNPEV